MFYYHTIKDLGIQGVYDHEPLIPKYHFPSDEFWKDRDVLDVGCSTGFFSKHFVERGAKVTAVDITTEAVRMVKQKASLSSLKILEGDIFDMSFNREFDFAFCGSLLMHAIYPMQLLKIIHRALRESGILILCSGGWEGEQPLIYVDRDRGRIKTPTEGELKSSHEALWWISQTAGIHMLANAGFKNAKYMDNFMLTSTPHGIDIGQHYSSLHYVWHAYKSVL